MAKIAGDCERLRRTKRYRELKAAMLADLEAAGINRLPYTEMVEQYMSLWVQLQLLEADVADRGVKVQYQNGATQKGVTENKSLTTAVQIGRRMDDILNRLGYQEIAKKQRIGAVGTGEDDEL